MMPSHQVSGLPVTGKIDARTSSRGTVHTVPSGMILTNIYNQRYICIQLYCITCSEMGYLYISTKTLFQLPPITILYMPSDVMLSKSTN